MAQLISGENIDDGSILFDRSTYHFRAGGADITSDLPRSEKTRLVSDFDVTRENYRLSQERGAGKYGQEALSESTTIQLADNLLTDPFAAPIESLGAKADQFFGTAGIKKLIVAGIVLLGIYLFIVGGWFKRKL